MPKKKKAITDKGLALIMNAAAQEQQKKQREADELSTEQHNLAKDFSALESFQKLQKEILPYLSAYLYAARITQITKLSDDKQFDLWADTENDTAAIAVRISHSDYFVFGVCSDGYYKHKKPSTPQYLSTSDLKKPESGEFFEVSDIYEDIGCRLENKHDQSFKDYFEKYIQSNGKCLFTHQQDVSPKLRKHNHARPQ